MLSGLAQGITSGTFAYGINNKGQVAGFLMSGNRAVAVRWTGIVPEILDSLSYTTGSVGYAINNTGQIAGVSEVTVQQAVRWTGTAIEPLPALPDTWTSEALDINDDGWVVGSSVDLAHHVDRPFVFDGSETYNLNDLILNPVVGVVLSSATAINNIGQIVGSCYKEPEGYFGFIATPVSPRKRQRLH